MIDYKSKELPTPNVLREPHTKPSKYEILPRFEDIGSVTFALTKAAESHAVPTDTTTNGTTAGSVSADSMVKTGGDSRPGRSNIGSDTISS